MKIVFYTLSCIGLLLLSNISNIYAQFSSGPIDHFLGVTGDLSAPLRVATHPDGSVYITDAAGRSVTKYDPSGNFLETISVVLFPISVAVNNEGQLFIGDGASGKIFRYNEAGEAIEFYDGTLYPSSMVFSPDNTLYVADSRLQEVIALDLSGNVVGIIGSGIVDFPTGLAFDASNQRILVGEHGGKGTGFKPLVKVWMFDLQGNLVKSFGSHGSGDGQFYRVQGLTVGKCGNIYVVDPFQSRISIFDESGNYLDQFGEFGFQSGELNVPMDIAFDFHEGFMVSSLNSGKLELFNITDTLPTSNMKTTHEMICLGETTTLEIEFTGTPPWDFSYTSDDENPTSLSATESPYLLSVSEAGQYEVIALSDAKHVGTCFTGSAQVSVADIPPSSTIVGDTSICLGETANISIRFSGSSPWEYTFTVDGLNPSTMVTTNNPQDMMVAEAGLYEITALKGGGCSGTSFIGSANIVVNELPTATIAEGNDRILIAPGGSADLTVGLSGNPPWDLVYTVDDLAPKSIEQIGEDVYTISADEEGTYEIKVVKDENCSNSNSTGYPEVVIQSLDAPPTSHIAVADVFICPGESIKVPIQFTGTPPWTFTYQLDTLMTTTIFNTFTNPYIINAVYAGFYEVTALSDSKYTGSEFTGKALVSINPRPVPGFDYVTDQLQTVFSNHSFEADTYLWDFGDGHSSVEINPLHQYQSEGEYTVSLTASNGSCGDSSISKTIRVTAVSAGHAEFENMLKVYPNPSTGLVTLEFNMEHPDVRIEIVGINGQLTYSNLFHSGEVGEELDLRNYPSGIYLVKIVSREFVEVRKLILNNSNRP